MTFHLRVHRWVVTWICVGVVCGAVALVIILGHHLTRIEDELLLTIGAAHWLLFGIVCWALDGIKVEPAPPAPIPRPLNPTSETVWHPASDFLLPGRKHSLLPWRH
jgi:hypothetical protein